MARQQQNATVEDLQFDGWLVKTLKIHLNVQVEKKVILQERTL